MQIGVIGLGKMGGNMALRLVRGGHEVHGYTRDYDPALGLEQEGVRIVPTLEALIAALTPPRVLWLMLPSGAAIDQFIETARPLLSPGDLLVDGGNSFYKDSVRRAEVLQSAGLAFVDAGTSGGVWGLSEGYCMMLGGSAADFARLEPALRTLAPEGGYLHVGTHGAGHYAKMVHNGIEYALMQSYAEGLDILAHAPYRFDLFELTRLWNRGAVIRSWLLELAERVFQQNPRLDGIAAYVHDSGMGRWTVDEAIDLAVPAPVITASLFARFRSRREESFSDRFLAALRNQFGGHQVKTKDPEP